MLLPLEEASRVLVLRSSRRRFLGSALLDDVVTISFLSRCTYEYWRWRCMALKLGAREKGKTRISEMCHGIFLDFTITIPLLANARGFSCLLESLHHRQRPIWIKNSLFVCFTKFAFAILLCLVTLYQACCGSRKPKDQFQRQLCMLPLNRDPFRTCRRLSVFKSSCVVYCEESDGKKVKEPAYEKSSSLQSSSRILSHG
jgi:hypothetical protein